MSQLKACDLGYAAAGKPLVADASFTLEPGQLTILIGPNGAGKSTLLRMTLGLLEPDSGAALLDNVPIHDLSPMQRARKIAYLPQTRPLVWPQPVRDVVALGRFAYGAAPAHLSGEDHAAVARAITACQLDGFEERAADTLSGGELSRVHLARALAAETKLIIADEPVAALDPRHQHQTMRRFAAVTRDGRGVLAVVHDLNLAARYADRLIWMKGGRIVADGTAQETFTADRLRDVFGVEAEIDRARDDLRVDISGPS